MEAQLGRLASGVGHIQVDITDIKTDLRRTNDRLGALSQRCDAVGVKVDKVREELTGKVEAGRAELVATRTELTGRVEKVREELTGKVEDVRAELTDKIEGVREELNDRIERVREELIGRIESVRRELEGQINELRRELAEMKASISSTRVWVLGLQLTQSAGLLLVMARGFQWI